MDIDLLYVQCDRFIPSFDDLDVEINHFNLTKENACPNPDFASPSKVEFANALENTLFEGKTQGRVSNHINQIFY